MPRSVESSRPIISKRDNRTSTYTAISSTLSDTQSTTAPSLSPSAAYSTIEDIQQGLKRMEDPRVEDQGYEMNEEKKDWMAKLGMVAKVDKALRWRMDNQDATQRPRPRAKTG